MAAILVALAAGSVSAASALPDGAINGAADAGQWLRARVASRLRGSAFARGLMHTDQLHSCSEKDCVEPVPQRSPRVEHPPC